MPFVAPIPHPGLLVPGTIDIDFRKVPLTFNKNGTISSVSTASREGLQGDVGRIAIPARVWAKHPSVEVCYPQVIRHGGKWILASDSVAWAYAKSTGKHLGVFDTWQHADPYTQGLHVYLAKFTTAWLKKHRRRG